MYIYIHIYLYIQSYLLIILPSHVKQMVTSFLLSLSEDVTSIGIRRSSSISREAEKGHGIFFMGHAMVNAIYPHDVRRFLFGT